jgi:hypothetical protein
MASSGGAIIETAAITASRALVSDVNGIPTHSSVTGTELGYLSGVTSAVQTQIDGKAASTGWSAYSVMGTNVSGALSSIAGATGNTMLQWTVTGPVWSSASYPSTTTANQLLFSSANNVVGGLTSANNAVLTTNGTGVPSWSALSSDTFAQYALLAGRAGGQTLTGGTAAGENLTLESTSNTTKGTININPSGGIVKVGGVGANASVDMIVKGVVRSEPVIVTFVPNGTTAVDMIGSQNGYTVPGGPGTCALEFQNIKDGASYTFIVKGGDSNMCALSFKRAEDGIALNGSHMSPPNGNRMNNTHTIYNFFRMGDDVYVSWVTGL